MEPTELRINNLVRVTGTGSVKIPMSTVFKIVTLKLFQVDLVREDEIPAQVEHFMQKNYYELSPIPLTEEWLIRFGFIYDENLFGLKMPLPDVHVRFTSPRWVTRNLVADLIETPFLRFDATHTDVYFVHSLQNLFYALTGQELTLSPPQP